MDEVEARLRTDLESKSHFLDVLRYLLPDLATQTWEGKPEHGEALLRFCERHPVLGPELDMLRFELEPLLGSRDPLLLTLRLGPETRAVLQVPSGLEPVSVPDIVPGRYAIHMSTGRLIWEGEILPQQVLWAESHPGCDLEMAAQMGESEEEPTYVEPLLDGELELRLYPGLEGGTLQLTRGERDTETGV